MKRLKYQPCLSITPSSAWRQELRSLLCGPWRTPVSGTGQVLNTKPYPAQARYFNLFLAPNDMFKNSMPMKALINLILLLVLSGVVLAASSPTALIKNGIDNVLSILNDKSLDPAQRRAALDKEIRRVVKERFEFESMSKSVLSTNWRKATGYEQDRFVDFFAETLVNTYITAIESYSGEEIKYVGEKIKGDRAVVKTIIVTKNADIPVNYKMRLANDEWYVYDVVIENASLVSNYRNLYTAIIKSSGINGLLDKLEKGLKTKPKAEAGK